METRWPCILSSLFIGGTGVVSVCSYGRILVLMCIAVCSVYILNGLSSGLVEILPSHPDQVDVGAR